MTTLGLRRVRRVDARTLAVLAAFAVWAFLVIGSWVTLVSLPGGLGTRVILTLGVPPLLTGYALIRRGGSPAVPFVAGASVAIGSTVILVQIISQQPQYAYAAVAVVVGAVVTQRHPTLALGTMFVIAGAHGSIRAFTGLPALQLSDAILAGFWAGVIGRLLIGRRPLPIRPTPAFFLLAALMVLAIGAMVTADPLGMGIRGFRTTWMHFSAMILVGYAALRAHQLHALARAMAVVCLLVSAYAALRWAIGPDPREAAINHSEGAKYNRAAGEDKVQGSLFNGQGLGVWLACAIPFMVATGIAWRGRFQLIALAGLPCAIIAMLGSGQRAVVPAAFAGALTVIVIHMVSRSFRGPRLGVALAAVAVLMGSAAVFYPAVLDNPEKRQRYENILTPGEDVPFQERVIKWKQVLADLEGQPFGYGMGAGDVSIPKRFATVSTDNIDNSYLMIAYDQGLVIMALFILAMLVVLFELVRHAIWTRGTRGSALATAAAGTLVSMLVEFVAANHITSAPVVTGWLIVGLGVAQFGSRREAEEA